ncbi:hypothetical protein MARI151_20174 [Maribacter litoralis]|uniref:Uncharacterized protein n=1 Tax=Maribacter litoralis TaxID=2059726 RepID=A0A653PAL8_9FLAO|nr:hypothetical protein MARI151_20174 [Maribacter litoralis]
MHKCFSTVHETVDSNNSKAIVIEKKLCSKFFIAAKLTIINFQCLKSTFLTISRNVLYANRAKIEKTEHQLYDYIAF